MNFALKWGLHIYRKEDVLFSLTTTKLEYLRPVMGSMPVEISLDEIGWNRETGSSNKLQRSLSFTWCATKIRLILFPWKNKSFRSFLISQSIYSLQFNPYTCEKGICELNSKRQWALVSHHASPQTMYLGNVINFHLCIFQRTNRNKISRNVRLDDIIIKIIIVIAISD